MSSRIFKIFVSTSVSLILLGTATLVFSPRNVLPAAIQSAVLRAPEILNRAWQLPVASTFERHITWQSNPSLCGPASVANTFRSLGERATTQTEVLAGTGRCWTGYCLLGLTLDQLAEVAQAHTGRKVTVLRDLTADEFRQHMQRANDPGRRYIINFSRDQIFGAGAGHHSPIAGYLEAEDMVSSST
jgi:hypothetical protein